MKGSSLLEILWSWHSCRGRLCTALPNWPSLADFLTNHRPKCSSLPSLCSINPCPLAPARAPPSNRVHSVEPTSFACGATTEDTEKNLEGTEESLQQGGKTEFTCVAGKLSRLSSKHSWKMLGMGNGQRIHGIRCLLEM